MDSNRSGNLNDETAPPWTLETIQRHALAEFQGPFEALPGPNTLRFEIVYWQGKVHRAGPSSWPIGALSLMLVVGVVDAVTDWTEPPVYAFVHGEGQNEIGYCYQTTEESTMVLLPRNSATLGSVEFEEPFCDLADQKTSISAVYARGRALVLYYFLVCGHIKEITYYRSFLLDFKTACGWVANQGKRPKVIRRTSSSKEMGPQHENPNGHDKQSNAPAKMKREWDDSDTVQDRKHQKSNHDARSTQTSQPSTAALKNPTESNSHATASPQDPGSIKHFQARNVANETELTRLRLENGNMTADCISYDLQCTTLRSDKAELQTKIERLRAENARLQQQREYDSNAYNGLKHEYEQIEAKYGIALERAVMAEGLLKEQKRRVTDLEKRVADGEVELSGVRRDFDRLRGLLTARTRELDDKYGAAMEVIE